MSLRIFSVGCLALAAMLDVDSSQLKTSLTYKEHSDFVRLSEFFNGRENTGQRFIVRSQSDSRTGLYFSLSLKVLELPERATVHLDIVRNSSPEPHSFKMVLPQSSLTARELLVGLTGKDWSGPEERPVAWHLQLLDGEGEVFASEKSFLWEK